jgi:hypothetical protein
MNTLRHLLFYATGRNPRLGLILLTPAQVVSVFPAGCCLAVNTVLLIQESTSLDPPFSPRGVRWGGSK